MQISPPYQGGAGGGYVWWIRHRNCEWEYLVALVLELIALILDRWGAVPRLPAPAVAVHQLCGHRRVLRQRSAGMPRSGG